jgi:transportin-3
MASDQQSPAAELQSYIYALYHAPSTTLRERANSWLQSWQSSAAAWGVAHDILLGRVQLSPSAPSSEAEVLYFAAQTLRTKIMRDFEELDVGMRNSLPESLLVMLGRHYGVSFVRTQLCLGVAGLGMRIPSGSWTSNLSGSATQSCGMIDWVAQRLYNEPALRHALLEILTVVPQEASAYQPSILPGRRREIEREMRVEGLPKALEVLQVLITGETAGGTTEKKHVLEAFAAWLRLGGSGIETSILINSKLVPLALSTLQKEDDSFYAAVDAVVEIIYCSSSHGRPKAELAPLVQAIVLQVMSLRPQFDVCIQQALDEAAGTLVEDISGFGEHSEHAKALARLFAEVGEAYADLICEATPEVLGPVEALLDVCRYPDIDVCSISFNFWHRVSFILSAGKKPHGLNWEGDVLPEDEAERRLAAFRGYYERLVVMLMEKTRYPEESDYWHTDEKNEFKYTRQSIGDLLLDATDVIGPDSFIRLAIEPLSEVSARMNAGGNFEWRKAEASLYCLRSVHRASTSLQDGGLMMSILSSLSYLPSHPQLDYSVSLMLGSYSEWLAREAEIDTTGNVASLIQQLIELIVKGLGNDHTSAACALSLRNICDSCGKFLVQGSNGPEFLEKMLGLYRQVQMYGDVSTVTAASQGSQVILDEEDVENILEAVTIVISQLPPDVKRVNVQSMLESAVQPIQMILENPGRDQQSGSDHLIVLPLFERIVTILRNVDDVEDVAITLEKLLPWLDTSFKLFHSDAAASEKVCRVPRYAVRTAKKRTVASLPALSTTLMTMFEQTKHSCYLYVASELIKTFGDDPSQDVHIQPLLCRMLISSCSILGSLQAVSENPDLTDDTFLLAGRGLSYAPRLILVQELLPMLIETCRNALLVQHKDACSSVASFLIRLLDPGTHRLCEPMQVKMLESVFQSYASILTQLSIAGAVGALPASRVYEMTNVLYALLKASQNSVESVGRVQLALARIPDAALPEADKNRFLQLCSVIVSDEILEDDVNQLHEGLVELSECCRRHARVQAMVMEGLLDPQYRYFN